MRAVFGNVSAGADAFEAASADLAALRARRPAQVGALVTDRHPPEAAPAPVARAAAGIRAVVRFGEGT